MSLTNCHRDLITLNREEEPVFARRPHTEGTGPEAFNWKIRKLLTNSGRSYWPGTSLWPGPVHEPCRRRRYSARRSTPGCAARPNVLDCCATPVSRVYAAPARLRHSARSRVNAADKEWKREIMTDTSGPFGQPENEFTLPSNSGYREMKFTLLRRVVVDHVEACLCSVVLTGRDLCKPIDQEGWEVADDCTVHLHQVLVSVSRLVGLAKELLAWLQQPIMIEHELALRRYESLSLSVGPEEGIISSAEKPVARLAFAAAGLRGDYGFVVDQSCIRLFHAALERAIRNAR
jgi:hypothetical protein